MTVRYIAVCTSDVTGEEGAETVQVPAFDIDLTPAEKAEMFRVLAPYLQHGRKGRVAANASGVTSRGQHTTSKALAAERKAAREWLNGHGYTVGVKGVIKKETWEAYQSKTPAPGWSQPVTPAVTPSDTAKVQTVKPSKKTQAQMSPAFKAAEEAAGIGPAFSAGTLPMLPTAEQVRNVSAKEAAAMVTPVKTPQKAATPRKAAALRKTTDVVPLQPQRASKAAPARAAAATKTAPRKTTATAKVSRAK